MSEIDARCGMIDIAWVTVGAAFVGAVASTLVIAELLRLLHDGPRYSVTGLDLRTPSDIAAAPAEDTIVGRLPPSTPTS